MVIRNVTCGVVVNAACSKGEDPGVSNHCYIMSGWSLYYMKYNPPQTVVVLKKHDILALVSVMCD